MTHRSRLSYANVASTLALTLVVGGGTAYAAGLVRTDDLARGAVTTPKLAPGAVTGPKVEDGSLGLADLATAPLSSAVTRRVVVFITATPGQDGTVRERTVLCRDGETVLGGGYEIVKDVVVDGRPNTSVAASRPTVDGTGTEPQDGEEPRGWYVEARRDLGTSESVFAGWVLCGS